MAERLKAAHVPVGAYVFADAWHGGGAVTESRPSGHLWCLKFDAPVVNPPAVWYGSCDALVPVSGASREEDPK